MKATLGRTLYGAVVLTHGRDLLAKAKPMAAAIDRFKAGDGRVDIGTFQSVSNVILPLVVRRLRGKYPSCDIRLFEEETDQPHVRELRPSTEHCGTAPEAAPTYGSWLWCLDGV